MSQQKPNPDDISRIIVLIYGMLDAGGPFWAFAAVRPTKYDAFTAAQKEGKLNLHEFTGFGEIIVSGKGKSPPDEVILKIAEMYQTSPETLMQGTEEPASESGKKG